MSVFFAAFVAMLKRATELLAADSYHELGLGAFAIKVGGQFGVQRDESRRFPSRITAVG